MTMESITLVAAIVGVVGGITGSILGIINTWQLLRRNKVRLKVVPQHIIPVGSLANAPIDFGIDVINLSEFPVVIADIGFKLTGGRHATLTPVDGIEDKGSLPLRLEPHTIYSKLFHADQRFTEWSSVICAYARTQCNTEATGTSPALKQLIQESIAGQSGIASGKK